MLQMMLGTGGPSPAAAANTTVGECEGVQQCCYGGRASRDGQWLQRNIPAAYPHVRFLDSCVTKQGAGTRAARDYKDWRTIPVARGESYVVNSSPRHCKICQRKVREAVNAVHEAQVGGAETGVETGGDSGADVELDISRAMENVLIMQLLHRNTSLRRSLSQSCKELSRLVCMCVYMYMHM